MNTQDYFQSAFGVELEAVRNYWMATLSCVGVLYLYRLITVIRCMRAPLTDFLTPIDRLIWVGLAMFVPLGIGAYLFDVTVKRFYINPLFLVPIGFLCFVAIKVGYPLITNMTHFKFDFLGL